MAASYNSNILLFPLLTVRDGDTVKHYRIRQLDEGGFFIARRVTFQTLSELCEHYSKDADGLCVNLRKPCSQVCKHICIKRSRPADGSQRINWLPPIYMWAYNINTWIFIDIVTRFLARKYSEISDIIRTDNQTWYMF